MKGSLLLVTLDAALLAMNYVPEGGFGEIAERLTRFNGVFYYSQAGGTK